MDTLFAITDTIIGFLSLSQTWAPLTETRARSELSAQCLKVSGFPLALFTQKKNSVKNLYFLLLLFL